MFNALKYIRTLESVGFKREQAEAQVQLVMDTYEENVATKADLASTGAEIAELRSSTTAEFTKMRSELRTEIALLRTELKTDIAALKLSMSDMFVKFTSIVIGSITLATALVGFLIKF